MDADPKFHALGNERFQHVATGLKFTKLIGGRFQMGMSEAEETQLRNRPEDVETDSVECLLDAVAEMRPVRSVTLKSFLLADFPLMCDFVGTNHPALDPFQLEEDEPAVFQDVEKFLPDLSRYGFRLPSESEWEYAHRELVIFERFPDENLIEPEQDEHRLTGLGTWAEVCADFWFPSLTETPTDGSPRAGEGERVLRGGAGLLYPWQACGEWQLLLPYTRAPESTSDFCSIRPAISWSDIAVVSEV